MSYINSTATTAYKEALRATETIEEPALGFIKPGEFKEGIQKSVSASIKQNNTLIQLVVALSEKVDKLEEKIQKLSTTIKATAEPLPADLITKLENLSIQKNERPKELKGKRLVFRDPLDIVKDELKKING